MGYCSFVSFFLHNNEGPFLPHATNLQMIDSIIIQIFIPHVEMLFLWTWLTIQVLKSGKSQL